MSPAPEGRPSPRRGFRRRQPVRKRGAASAATECRWRSPSRTLCPPAEGSLPHAGDELARLGPDRGGVEGGGVEARVPEHRGDGGKGHAGGDCGDAVGVPETSRAGLGAFDARRGHERAHLAVRRLAGDGPQCPGARPGARLGASDAVHELELVHQVLRNRNGSPVFPAALERGNPQLRGLEVDVARSKRQRLADAATGQGQRARERLHGGLAVGPDRGEEAGALLRGEVLPAAGVDEGHFGAGRHGRRPPGRVSRKVTLPYRKCTDARFARLSQGLCERRSRCPEGWGRAGKFT